MRINRLYFNVLVSHLDLVFCVMGHMERGGGKNPFMSDQCLFIKIRAQLYIIWPSCKVLICCEYQGGGSCACIVNIPLVSSLLLQLQSSYKPPQMRVVSRRRCLFDPACQRLIKQR